MDKETLLLSKVGAFITNHHIDCVEDVYQRDSVNESCVNLVAELVEIMLEE